MAVDAARQVSIQTTPSAAISGTSAAAPPPAELAPKMEGDSEYGVQKVLYRRSNPEPFNVTLDLGYYYTDNVALVDKGEQDDFFLRSGLRASYVPQIKGNIFFSTSAGSEIYRYADNDFFDFDLLTFDAGLLYATPQKGTVYDPLFGDLVGYVRYGFYRVADSWEWNDPFLDNHSLIAGFQKTWRISRGQQVYAGANADWSMEASEAAPQRHEYTAFAGYKVKWTADLESNVLYRAAIYDYQEVDRSDFNQILSFGLTWRFNDWFAANAAVSAAFNNSDRSVFDYEALNTGLTLVLQARW